MTLFLTEPQHRALDATNGATRLVHPVTGVEYVLLPAAEYDAVRELVEDDRERRAFAEFATQQLAARLLADERADGP